MQGPVAQIRSIGLAQVFGHVLSVGQEHQWQFVPNQAIEHRTNLRSLVGFGDDGSHQGPRLFALSRLLVHQDHVFLCAQIGGAAHHQNTFERRRTFVQQLRLFQHLDVSLAHACRVQQDHTAIAHAAEFGGQVIAVAQGHHRHANDLGIHLQLLLRPDAEGVGGQQGQLLTAIAQHAASSNLGDSGCLADPCGANEGKNTTGIKHRKWLQGLDFGFQQSLQAVYQAFVRCGGQSHQVIGQLRAQLGRKPGVEQNAKRLGLVARLGLQVFPGAGRQMGLQQLLDLRKFGEQLLNLQVRRTHGLRGDFRGRGGLQVKPRCVGCWRRPSARRGR